MCQREPTKLTKLLCELPAEVLQVIQTDTLEACYQHC